MGFCFQTDIRVHRNLQRKSRHTLEILAVEKFIKQLVNISHQKKACTQHRNVSQPANPPKAAPLLSCAPTFARMNSNPKPTPLGWANLTVSPLRGVSSESQTR